MNELQHKIFTKQPNFDFSNLTKRSSTHIANNIGDKSPPCLTPEEIKKTLENLSFHLTYENNLLYQLENISITRFGTFLSISFKNSILKFTLSNALERSKEHILTVEPLVVK